MVISMSTPEAAEAKDVTSVFWKRSVFAIEKE